MIKSQLTQYEHLLRFNVDDKGEFSHLRFGVALGAFCKGAVLVGIEEKIMTCFPILHT